MKKMQAQITERMSYLANIISSTEKSLQNAPTGKLRSSLCGRHIRYYRCEEPDSHNGRYLNKSESAVIYALAQKEYDEKVLSSAKTEYMQLETLKTFYKNSSVESVLGNIHKNRKTKIKPLLLPDEEYVAQWQSQTYEPSEHSCDENLISDRGEKMRSKSEVLIANALNRYNIPYHYEKPLYIDGKVLHPDFTILNVRFRSEYIWEHFGKMGDQAYAENVMFKLNRYMTNGFLPGKNLIFTVESQTLKFGTRQIETMIHEYLI